MKPKDRGAIPSELKRKVRQRCGFGCALCGSPIYDYEHIEDYAHVRKHEYENLVLLCPTCHRKKTKGLLPKELIIKAREDASNRSRTTEDELVKQDYQLIMGANVIQTFSGVLFSIYGFGQLSVELKGYHPSINGFLLDGNGRKAIEIIDNVYTLSSKTWDIEYVGNALTFRNGFRKVFARLIFDVLVKRIFVLGDILLPNGLRIRITDDGIFAGQAFLAGGNRILHSESGLIITNKAVEGAHFTHVTINGVILKNFGGIAIHNATNCMFLDFESCQHCFVWDIPFLETLIAK